MSIRKTLFTAAIAAALVPAAFAAGDVVWVGGEIGYQLPAQSGTLSREQVRAELQSFRSAQVAADGSSWVGGEAGWVPHQHGYMMANGVRMHTGTLSVMGNARALQPAAPYAPAGDLHDHAGG